MSLTNDKAQKTLHWLVEKNSCRCTDKTTLAELQYTDCNNDLGHVINVAQKESSHNSLQSYQLIDCCQENLTIQDLTSNTQSTKWWGWQCVSTFLLKPRLVLLFIEDVRLLAAIIHRSSVVVNGTFIFCFRLSQHKLQAQQILEWVRFWNSDIVIDFEVFFSTTERHVELR